MITGESKCKFPMRESAKAWGWMLWWSYCTILIHKLRDKEDHNVHHDRPDLKFTF